MNRKRILIPLLAATAVSAVAAAFYEGRAQAKDDLYEQLKPLMETLTYIQADYVDADKTKSKDLVSGAIKGMVSGLDPFSQYLDLQASKEMEDDTHGTFGGLGIEIAIKAGLLTVVSPIEGTPAYRAGIKSGDTIVRIGQSSTENIQINEAVKKMRGPKGTQVTISIMREGFKAPQEFTLTRDTIKIQNVKTSQLDGGVAYVRLAQFMGDTVDQDFSKAVRQATDSKAAGLIVDLRNNPGGLLDQAARIAGNFVPKDLMVVYTEGRIKSQNRKFLSEGGVNWKGPLVVLINGGSASASEILAGAVQDHGLGVLVGTKSFGKGSVQTILRLSDGSGLRLTTAAYFTPKGRRIHGKGVEPDVVAEEEAFSSQINAMFTQEIFAQYAKGPAASYSLTATAKVEGDGVKVSENNWENLKPETRDQKLLKEFSRYCEDKVKGFHEDQFWADRTRILTELKREIARRGQGEEEARRIGLMGDPQVQRALDVIKIQTLTQHRVEN
jgi:carboxyl-terminal processing protease